MENVYNSVVHHCDGFEIVMVLEGNDELLGWNTFKIFNAIYHRKAVGFVYSNFYEDSEGQRLIEGQVSEYTSE